MEFTREDIKYFYTQYIKNLEEEENIKAMILKTTDENDWVCKLRSRDTILQKLFDDNERLIAEYITPFLSGEVLLTDELAEEFLEQLTIFCQRRFNDYLAGVEVGYLVEKHYENTHQLENKIHIWHILGAQLSRFYDVETLKISIRYFDKEKQMLSFYKEIDDWRTRRSIVLSSYNYCVVLLFILTYIEDQSERDRYQAKLLYELVASIKVYEREDIRALDGDKLDFDELEKELKRDICGGWISRLDPNGRILPDFLAYADYVLTDLYQAEMSANSNLVDVDEEIFCCYYKCLLLKGKIDRVSFMKKYMDYCDQVLKNCHKEINSSIQQSRYYSICVYQITTVLPYLIHDDIPKERQEKMKKYCLKTFLYVLEIMAKSSERENINQLISDELPIILQYLPDDISPFNLIFRVMGHSNEVVMLHTVSVANFTKALMEQILHKCPELLLGILGTQSVDEVVALQEEISLLAGKASVTFDIGKVNMMDYVGKVTRRLCAYEKNRIELHPQLGEKYIESIRGLNRCKDVAIGHHKSYDGMGGYPDFYNQTESELYMIIEIVKFCDELDNATSTNKSYCHKVVTFDEFLENALKEKSNYFHPQLLAFIANDEETKSILSKMSSTGRDDMYREVYSEYYKNEATLEELYKDSITIKNDHEIEADVRIETFFELVDILLNKDISEKERKELYVLRSNVKRMQEKKQTIHVHLNFSE